MAVTDGQVRRFLRDFAGNNVLLDEVEFEDEDVRDATFFAISEFNAITPVTSFTEDNFPNDWVLLMGICAHLFRSESFLQLRNQATYQDGDIQVGIDDKFALYDQLADKLTSVWKQTAADINKQLNMEAAYGSLSSGYRYVYPGFRSKYGGG